MGGVRRATASIDASDPDRQVLSERMSIPPDRELEPESDGPLVGIRVIECGGLVAAAYAAKLMADLGADVIKVEPPEGDMSRRRGPFPPGREDDLEASGLFIFLNANKRGVMLDLSERDDRSRFLALLGDADVLVHNLQPRDARRLGIDDEELRGRYPRLIHTWITPFGLTGPHAEYAADELTVLAAGGWLSMSPGDAPDLSYPPLKPFGRQADYQAGSTAAVATMGALYARDFTGEGQLVDVSGQEVVGTEVEVALAHWTYAGDMRTHSRRASAGGALRCKDGHVFAAVTQPERWAALVDMIGNPEWAQDPQLAEQGAVAERWQELRPLIELWTSERTVGEVVERGARARLPFAPVSTVASLIASPHLQERGFFRTVAQPGVGEVIIPGPPYGLERTPWQLRRPAPRRGEHNAEIFATKRERFER